MMTLEIATKLVDAISEHPGLFPIDKERFIRSLTSVKIQPTSKFHIDLPDNESFAQVFQETTDKYYCLSIRRILINKNVCHKNRIPFLKKALNVISGIRWSSSVISRELRLNKEISNLILESSCPLAMLGKLQIYEYCDNNNFFRIPRFFRISRPILVIINKNKRKDYINLISKWETENTLYEKEVGILFRYFKKISCKEYLAYS